MDAFREESVVVLVCEGKMADGAERQSDIVPGGYDQRRDANWQARLEEARAKREIALRKKRANVQPKKRLKPWEEEGAAVLDEDMDFSPASTGLEFSDRVDAMRVQGKPKYIPFSAPAPVESETPTSQPGSNWSPDIDQEPLAPVPAPEPERATEAPIQAPQPSARVSSVNDVFSDPIFDEPPAAKEPDPKADEEADTIPIALLRVPPPEPARRRVPVIKDEPEVSEVEAEAIDTETATSALEPAKKPIKKRSGLMTMAVFFLAAIAIGPIYKFTQPIERGPLVYTLSSFPVEPAFGLTSPMFEQPTPTKSREWRPASLVPTDELLALAQPNVPERARTLANFVEMPAFGPANSSIVVGDTLWSLPHTADTLSLPQIAAERPLGPEGRVAGLGSGLDDVSQPAPRPDEAANG